MARTAAISVPVLLSAFQAQADPYSVDEATRDPLWPLQGQETTDYQQYAPAGSYDPNLKPGSVKLLIAEVTTSEDRHDELVAHIARLSSEKMARILGLDERPRIYIRDMGDSDAILMRMQEADVVNYSVGIRPNNLSNLMESQDESAHGIQTLFIQATGNYGNDDTALSDIDFDRDTADNRQLSPHSITVGEAEYDSSGGLVISEGSARNGPTLAAVNPTYEGQCFRYAETVPYDAGLTIGPDGMICDIPGTSFSSPVVSGALASAKIAYPAFSNTELLTVALASNKPPPDDHLMTDVTPASLSYESYQWGYGVFDHELFAQNLEIMQQVRELNGDMEDLSQQQTGFAQRLVENQDGTPSHYVHAFEITEDIAAGKIIFNLQIPLQTNLTNQMLVVSPSGNSRLVPTSVGLGTNTIVTEAFWGESAKGTWQIITDAPTRAVVPGDQSYETLSAVIDPDGDWRDPENRTGASLTVHGQAMAPDGRSNVSDFFARLETPEPVPFPVRRPSALGPRP